MYKYHRWSIFSDSAIDAIFDSETSIERLKEFKNAAGSCVHVAG
jgi:hypothetical protein